MIAERAADLIRFGPTPDAPGKHYMSEMPPQESDYNDDDYAYEYNDHHQQHSQQEEDLASLRQMSEASGLDYIVQSGANRTCRTLNWGGAVCQ